CKVSVVLARQQVTGQKVLDRSVAVGGGGGGESAGAPEPATGTAGRGVGRIPQGGAAAGGGRVPAGGFHFASSSSRIAVEASTVAQCTGAGRGMSGRLGGAAVRQC